MRDAVNILTLAVRRASGIDSAAPRAGDGCMLRTEAR